MSSPGTGIHYIVDVPTSEYGLGKRGSADLQACFPASPAVNATPSAGVGIGERLTNANVVGQANRFLETPVEGNDLFGGTVDLRYHHPDGPTNLQPPALTSPNQTINDRSGTRVFAWAPNVASGDINTGAQPDPGVDVSVRITDGAGAAFNAPAYGINPKATSQNVSEGLRIGSLRLGVGSAPRT